MGNFNADLQNLYSFHSKSLLKGKKCVVGVRNSDLLLKKSVQNVGA